MMATAFKNMDKKESEKPIGNIHQADFEEVAENEGSYYSIG